MLKDVEYLLSGKDFNDMGDKRRKEIIDRLTTYIPDGKTWEEFVLVVTSLRSHATILSFISDGLHRLELSTANLEGQLQASLNENRGPVSDSKALASLAALINYNKGAMDAFNVIKEMNQAVMENRLEVYMENIRLAAEESRRKLEENNNNNKEKKLFVGAGSKVVN